MRQKQMIAQTQPVENIRKQIDHVNAYCFFSSLR